jgi:hypothetical protein
MPDGMADNARLFHHGVEVVIYEVLLSLRSGTPRGVHHHSARLPEVAPAHSLVWRG